LDWKKEDLNPVMGPPLRERVANEYAVKLLNDAGFSDIKTIPLYSSSFVIVSKK